jgi:hypothetical protein
MIEDALYYPTESEAWEKTVAIGSGLLLVPQLAVAVFAFVAVLTLGIGVILFPLVLPFFLTGLLVSGFYVQILRATVAGEATYPEFDDWGRLLKDGVVAFVLGFVYALVPTVVLGVTLLIGLATGSLGGAGGAGDALGVLGLLVMLLGFLVALVIGLALLYVYPASLTNYAVRGRIGAAFAVDDLQQLLTSKDYATAWALAFGVAIATSVVGSIVGFVPIIGTFLSAPVSFYGGSVMHRLVGEGYRDAMS